MPVKIIEDMRVSLIVHLKNNFEGSNILTLPSAVEELPDDEFILINMPIHGGYYYPMPREPLLMQFLVDSKSYAMQVQFEDRVERNGLLFAKMRRQGKIREHQLRDCYRHKCSIPVIIERLCHSGEDDDPEAEASGGRILDLSDGGALFATDERIEKGEKIALTFEARGSETVEAKALRVETPEEGKYYFRVASKFKIDEQQANRIYKYIVDLQMEQRRRNLGL